MGKSPFEWFRSSNTVSPEHRKITNAKKLLVHLKTRASNAQGMRNLVRFRGGGGGEGAMTTCSRAGQDNMKNG